jgi:hypothetical protein
MPVFINFIDLIRDGSEPEFLASPDKSWGTT